MYSSQAFIEWSVTIHYHFGYLHAIAITAWLWFCSCLLSCVHVDLTAPNLLSVVASGPGTLTVTWKDPSSTNGEIINYNIHIFINDEAMVIESNGMGTEFDVTGLEPFIDYSVRVQACTSDGCGPLSNEITCTTNLETGEICVYNVQQC